MGDYRTAELELLIKAPIIIAVSTIAQKILVVKNMSMILLIQMTIIQRPSGLKINTSNIRIPRTASIALILIRIISVITVIFTFLFKSTYTFKNPYDHVLILV